MNTNNISILRWEYEVTLMRTIGTAAVCLNTLGVETRSFQKLRHIGPWFASCKVDIVED